MQMRNLPALNSSATSSSATAQWKYPEELRERAVKMVLEIQARVGRGRGEVAREPGPRLPR